MWQLARISFMPQYDQVSAQLLAEKYSQKNKPLILQKICLKK